jgi:ribonucleotide reductase beta subunit family protein with ferritin-like domain
MKTKMQTSTSSFVVHYPEAIEFADKQLNIFWLPDEIKVEKDIQDILVNMTESEKHGVITTLKLFSLYELFAGNEYWGGRFAKEFPRPELVRMSSVFSMMELAVHAPFYNKINEALHLNTDEFYEDYVNDETLKGRMEFIDSIVSNKDPLVSLGAFSMVEGAILYSSFAFLKHFQSQGKNKLLNIVRGINFSVRDENIHSMGGAWAFRQLLKESNLTEDQIEKLKTILIELAAVLYDHECRIIDMIFEKGPIDGITSKQMKHFVESRLNECMKELGFSKIYEVKWNPISDWFYDGINGYQSNDFFSGIGNSYNRNWDSTGFVWTKDAE